MIEFSEFSLKNSRFPPIIEKSILSSRAKRVIIGSCILSLENRISRALHALGTLISLSPSRLVRLDGHGRTFSNEFT